MAMQIYVAERPVAFPAARAANTHIICVRTIKAKNQRNRAIKYLGTGRSSSAWCTSKHDAECHTERTL